MKSISITRLKLDYVARIGSNHTLEMKSISITRLKLKKYAAACLIFIMGFAWNEKYLDYEIETPIGADVGDKEFTLEMKSISITRLKHQNIAAF